MEQIKIVCLSLFVFCGIAHAMSESEKMAHNKHLVNAVSQGDLACVNALLDAGADVNFEFYGDTALEQASYGGHREVVERLILAGARVNHISGDNKTALCSAVDGSCVEIVKILIQAGADVYHQWEPWGTPFRVATCYRSREMYELLFEKMLTIPEKWQKKTICFFLHHLKKNPPVKCPDLRDIFKIPLKESVRHYQATNPESRLRKELDSIVNQQIKEDLLKKYCNQ